MLNKRIVSGLLLFGALLAAVFVLPSVLVCVLLIAVAVVGLLEFYAMLSHAGIPVFRMFGAVSAGVLIAASCLRLNASALLGHAPAAFVQDLEWFVLFAIFFAIALRQFPQKNNHQPLATMTCTLFGVLYMPVLFTFLVRILFAWEPVSFGEHLGSTGRRLLLYLLVVVKSSDIGAYFVGSWLGRHKLFPRISPKKTWEGLAGGVVASVVASLVFCLIMPQAGGGSFRAVFGARVGMGWGDAVILGIGLALLGVLGDLMESLIKRAAGAKDSGHWIPGMGGMLDVIDSVVITAPVFYAYVQWFMVR